MSNSRLATVKVPASTSNYTDGRSGKKIKKITLHHVAGKLTAKAIGKVFQSKTRGASANYGIGSDGKIGLYVDECDTPWSDGNWNSNCTSVSIEVANSSTGGQWPVSKKSLQLTIELVADIAKRNGLGKLVAGKNLTWHIMYAAPACPGPYLTSQIKYIAQEANKILNGTEKPKVTTKKLYRVRKTWADAKSQLGAFSSLTSAKNLAKKNKDKGYEVYDASGKMVYDPAATSTSKPKKKTNTEIAREIIVGTCSDSRWKTWGIGDTRYSRLKKAGYDADAVQKIVNKLMK